MNYVLFGRSGLRVSEVALGTMTFGEDWGWGAAPEECRRMFDLFAQAGGNFVDTAGNYTDGTSEQIVGTCVRADRDHFVIATKYTLTERKEDPNFGGNHRKNLVRSLESSLRRLGTDYVDLLWLHMWDGLTPIEEVMRALDDLVRAGKVLYVGISDAPAWVVARANTLADLMGWSPFVGLQVPYSLLDRAVEREHLTMAAELGLAVTSWGLLEGGVLTGKYLSPSEEPRRYGSQDPSAAEKRLAEAVGAVAADAGRPAAQVAINWVRSRRFGCPIVPIVGARSADQLASNLGCLDWELTDGHRERLEEASDFRLGFARSFLESDHVRGLIFGSTWPRITDRDAWRPAS